MSFEQFIKQQRIRNVQAMSENNAAIRQQTKQSNAEISMSVGQLEAMQADILSELSESNPALAQELISLVDDVKESANKEFTKELTRNDRRFKPEEFDFSDLYGGSGSSITNHKFF